MRFQSFAEMLAFWAGRTPDAPALRFEARGGIQTMTYAALRDAVTVRSAQLRRSAGGCRGFLLETPTERTVVDVFAAVQAGRQVALLDGNAPAALLREQLRRTDADELAGDPELAEELRDALGEPCVADGAGQVLFFTSGTTARARAVVLTEQSLCASAHNGGALLPLSPEDTLLCMLPLNHVFGFVCGLLWGLSCGACVALGRGPRHYFDDCARFRPTALSAVPLLLGALLKQGALNEELKLLLIGAGDCPDDFLQAAKAGGCRVSFGYGLTETSSGVALSLGDDARAMTVCPDDRIEIAPDGEILISAPTCMFRGYYKRPEDTAAVLRDGVLRTGDLGFLDGDGKLHVTGRKKEILVLPDGTKLFLPEYEAAAAAALGTPELAVVLLGGAPALVLFGKEADRAAVLEKLAPVMAELPRGQQLRKLIFTERPLPRTATGKIKRWEIQREVENA